MCFEVIWIVHRSSQPISRNHNFSTNCVRTVYYISDFEIFEKDQMARRGYYPDDFAAHKNLFHKQFLPKVYYFMDGAVYDMKLWVDVSCHPQRFVTKTTAFSTRDNDGKIFEIIKR